MQAKGAGRRKSRLAHHARIALPVALAALLCLLTTASFMGSWSWQLDLLTHFRPQLAALGLVATVAALWAASWVPLALSIVLTIVNIAPVAPYLAGGARAAESFGTHMDARVRALTFNMHGESTEPEAFRRMVERENPDVLLLTEVPADTGALLQGWDDRFPYRIIDPRGSPFDVILLARWKPRSWSVDRSVEAYLPILTVSLCHPGAHAQCFTLVGLHAARPFGAGAERQKAQIDVAVREVRAASTRAVMLMGDLNLTPWSPLFRSFVDRAALEDAAKARSLAATWLFRFPLLGLSIDHVLVNAGFDVAENRVLENVGSDHLPVVADLMLRLE